MAKRDKNKSFSDWEEDWIEQDKEFEENQMRRQREKQRRIARQQNNKYNSDDWDDIE